MKHFEINKICYLKIHLEYSHLKLPSLDHLVQFILLFRKLKRRKVIQRINDNTVI